MSSPRDIITIHVIAERRCTCGHVRAARCPGSALRFPGCPCRDPELCQRAEAGGWQLQLPVRDVQRDCAAGAGSGWLLR